MNKTVLYNSEARAKVLSGVKKIASAVKVTLGPLGRCVLISEGMVVDYGYRQKPVHVSKDGYTVAKHFQLTDPLENVGAMMIQEAAQKTVDEAGDATTSTVVLAEAFIEKGIEYIDEGKNPVELKKEMEAAVLVAINYLKEIAIPVSGDNEKIKQIATVSANNDTVIGELIADTFKKIGNDGIITIEESNGMQTEIKVTDGFEFKRGYISPFFITDRSKNICELHNPLILIYEKPITMMKTLGPILEQVVQAQRSLLIICEEADGEALGTVIANVHHGNIKACIVRSPNFGDFKREIMEDIATISGGVYLSDSKGVGLENARLEHLGEAKKVIITKDNTTIIGGVGDKQAFDDLVVNLRMNLAVAKTDEDREAIEKRIAKLTESAAVIYVGATTETEMKEKKDRIDDAIRATKAAIAEGYVAGGGIVYRQLADHITEIFGETGHSGMTIVRQALREPLTQICFNAGFSEGLILGELGGNKGYNAKTEKVEDLIEAGIIDSAKVVRCAIQNAASVAGMVLISECMICDVLN